MLRNSNRDGAICFGLKEEKKISLLELQSMKPRDRNPQLATWTKFIGGLFKGFFSSGFLKVFPFGWHKNGIYIKKE